MSLKPQPSPVTRAGPVTSDDIERAARAMAVHAQWDGWDTAEDCNDTPNGNEPEEEREYWRELAKVALRAVGLLPDEQADAGTSKGD